MSKHSIVIQWSDEDKVFIAMIPELPGLSAFGKTPEKAVKELAKARELFIESMKDDGEAIPEPEYLKPFSGQLRIRIPKSLHSSLSIEAKREGVSLNTYMIQLLSERHALNEVKEEIKNLKNVFVANAFSGVLVGSTAQPYTVLGTHNVEFWNEEAKPEISYLANTH